MSQQAVDASPQAVPGVLKDKVSEQELAQLLISGTPCSKKTVGTSRAGNRADRPGICWTRRWTSPRSRRSLLGRPRERQPPRSPGELPPRPRGYPESPPRPLTRSARPSPAWGSEAPERVPR